MVWSIAASRWTCGLGWWPLPRRVLPSTATARRHGRGIGDGGVGGGCWAASHAPMARSSASASIRVSTRRTVASPGGRQTPRSGSRRTPSAASTWSGASLAHSPIAASDLAPVSTAATATASTVVSACRRPRRWCGSASWARSSSRLRDCSGASVAGAGSCWAAGMGDDERAATVVRSGLVMGFDTHMIAGSRACSTCTRPILPTLTSQTSPHYAEALRYTLPADQAGGRVLVLLEMLWLGHAATPRQPPAPRGSGAAALSGALRAFGSSARPRWWADLWSAPPCGGNLKPALAATQGDTAGHRVLLRSRDRTHHCRVGRLGRFRWESDQPQERGGTGLAP